MQNTQGAGNSVFGQQNGNLPQHRPGQEHQGGNSSGPPDEDPDGSQVSASDTTWTEVITLESIREHVQRIITAQTLLDADIQENIAAAWNTMAKLFRDAKKELETLLKDEPADSVVQHEAAAAEDSQVQHDAADGDGAEQQTVVEDVRMQSEAVVEDNEALQRDRNESGSEFGHETIHGSEEADEYDEEDPDDGRLLRRQKLAVRPTSSSTRANAPRRAQRRRTEIEQLQQINPFDSARPRRNAHFQTDLSLAGQPRARRNPAPVYTDDSSAQQQQLEEGEELENAAGADGEIDAQEEAEALAEEVEDEVMHDRVDENGDAASEASDAGNGDAVAEEARPVGDAGEDDEDDDPVIDHSLARRRRRNGQG